MSFQILSIASRRSIDTKQGEHVAICQTVLDFPSREQAETAYNNMMEAKRNKGVSTSVSLDVIRLYAH